MYIFDESNSNVKIEGRYWSANGFNVAVIASITAEVDWAAYVGADTSQREETTLQFVANYGCKLSESDARYFFPDINLPYRY